MVYFNESQKLISTSCLKATKAVTDMQLYYALGNTQLLSKLFSCAAQADTFQNGALSWGKLDRP